MMTSRNFLAGPKDVLEEEYDDDWILEDDPIEPEEDDLTSTMEYDWYDEDPVYPTYEDPNVNPFEP